MGDMEESEVFALKTDLMVRIPISEYPRARPVIEQH